MSNLAVTTMVISALGSTFPAIEGDSVPVEIRLVEDARNALETGRVELRVTRFRTNHGKPRSTYHTCRIAGEDVFTTNRGDAEGVVVRDVDGGYSGPADLRPRHALQKAGELFIYDQDDTDAESFPASGGGVAGALQIRSLGLSSRLEYRPVTDAMWGFTPDRSAISFDRVRDGNLRLIVATTDHGIKKWWLDMDRDGMPVRVTWNARNGDTQSDCRAEYSQFGGVWFPSRVEFFESGFKDGKEPAETVEIIAAEFNAPEHPRQFTLTDLGVEPGVLITRSSRPGQFVETAHWDGTRLISHNEYTDRIRSGELSPGPNYLRESARIRAVFEEAVRNGEVPGFAPSTAAGTSTENRRINTGPGQTVSEWEAYVRSFIARYRLDSDQEQKALDILRSCQDRATKYAATKAAEFDRVVPKSNGAKQLPADKRSEIVKAAEQEMAMLMRPISEIFESDLRPRLEKIPTRVQRTAAEERVTDRSATSSQPASPK